MFGAFITTSPYAIILLLHLSPRKVVVGIITVDDDLTIVESISRLLSVYSLTSY